MARKLRLEYEGALYHVMNRGNYRSAIFGTAGAREAFLKCLEEACGKAGWVVHAYILMSNHYHLALETPQGNLVAGMKWLQSTFANRYNRLRSENGHVFQGRYKAIVVEDTEGLGAVCHYIHLNPVRAKLLTVEQLGTYRDSSYWRLQNEKKRPTWLKLRTCLAQAGELADTPAGRRNYAEYLAWLAENEPAQKQLKFDVMTKGWALGSKGFKRALIEDHKKQVATVPAERETEEAATLLWQDLLERALKAIGKTRLDIRREAKAAPWKVAIASHLKTVSTATNVWLAGQLEMGVPSGVSRYVAQLKQGKISANAILDRIAKITV